MSLTYQSVDEVVRAYEACRARALAHCGGDEVDHLRTAGDARGPQLGELLARLALDGAAAPRQGEAKDAAVAAAREAGSRS